MSVLVYVENRNGELKKAGLEALSEGKRIAAARGTSVAAVIAGKGLDGTVDTLKAHGADKVFVADGDAFAHYNGEAHLAAVGAAIEQAAPNVILVAATSSGRDLAPRIAAKQHVMLLPDVTAITPDGDIVVKRPVYAGKVYMNIKAASLPVVISTRPNVFDVAEADGAGERVDLSVDVAPKANVVEVVAAASEKLDVAEADRIVAGGRGMKEAENFKLLEDLAETLGAAVGASRAVVDADWRPHSEQIGQTGKVVGPTLYIAAGISGAVQHLAGMMTSKVIVAINKDADAPIFKIADYGIVGDAMEVLPKLNDALK